MRSVMSYFMILLTLKLSESHSQQDVKRLYNDLFINYTKEILPGSDPSTPLNIGVQFYLCSVNYFREVEELISLFGVFSLNWTDPSLSWLPSQYGNLNSTLINPREMWTPSLFLMNRVDKMEPVGHDVSFQTTIFNNGNVYFHPGDIFEAKCPTDISNFPFDTQECELGIIPWGLQIDQLTLTSLRNDCKLEWFTSNSDWSLQEHSTRVGIKEKMSIFYVKLKIKRQPLYYTVVIILPTILFALLNPLVFVLPVESGERISLAMTMLLSYAIFLTLVSASIPTSSNPMCILLVFMIAIIAISGVITSGAIISSKHYHLNDTTEIWPSLQWFVKWRLRRKQNATLPLECEDKLDIYFTAKDVSKHIDFLFFYGAYIVIVFLAAVYFISVLT